MESYENKEAYKKFKRTIRNYFNEFFLDHLNSLNQKHTH